jgi:hypothetical protein
MEMKINTNLICCRRLILPAILLAAIFWGCAPAPVRRPVAVTVPPPGKGEINGKVFLNSNKVFKEQVSISAGGLSAVSGSGGGYALKGLPAGKTHLVAEARIGGRRHLAVAVVKLDEGEGRTMDLELRDASNVDTFCSDCHPYRNERTRRDQVTRDLHKSDIKPRTATKGPDMLDARGHVTCESCHTVHAETGIDHFMRYPYLKGELCIRCHS